MGGGGGSLGIEGRRGPALGRQTYLLGYFRRLASLGTTRSIGLLQFFFEKCTLSLLLSSFSLSLSLKASRLWKAWCRRRKKEKQQSGVMMMVDYEYVQLQVPS